MTNQLIVRRSLVALSAACLLSVALPGSAILAQEKTKTKTKPAAQERMVTDVSVTIPNIDAVDSSIAEDALRDILSGNLTEHASELAALDATSITVPEITVTVSSTRGSDDYETVMTFNDLVLTDVVDGVAASASMASLNMVSDQATFDFGTMSVADFNIGGVLGVYGLVTSTDTEMTTLYTEYNAEGGTLVADDVECTIGGVYGASFKARSLRTSFADMMGLAQAAEAEGDDMDPALIGEVMRMYADILTAFETSEVQFDGLSCEGFDDEDNPMEFAIAGMNVGGMSPGIYPSISMDGFSIVVEGDGSFILDNFTMKPMDLTGVIATLESAPQSVNEAWLEANVRGLIPAMEGLSVSGFSIDIPDPDNADARIAASVGAFDLTLGSYLNGIPTALEMSAANIQADLPEEGGDEMVEQLRALGITSVDAGFRIAAAWDEASDTVDISEVSVTGVDLATVKLTGTIANATADLFALDADTALMAAMSVAVQGLDLSVVDAGLSDIIVSMVAADQGADPATLRPVFAGLAQGTVIAMMAGAADAAKLGEAINSFVSGKAKTLEIGIEAKEAPGLSMADFMEAEEDPTTLIGKVNINAQAK